MTNFATAYANETRKTLTLNGATAYNSTGHKVLDLFAVIGALRMADDNRVTTLFEEAFGEDQLLAFKTLFYGRDVRGGLGERMVFRTLLTWCAKKHTEALRKNIALIPFYGRYDDLYALVGTPLEAEMWKYVKAVLDSDIEAEANGKPATLLAKWLKTADASSKATRALGIKTAKSLGYSVYDYKRVVRKLRRYLKVTEVYLSAKEWTLIDYESVPSQAMRRYRNAFQRHDQAGFEKYLEDVKSGAKKINASTLYPYDILRDYVYGGWRNFWKTDEDAVLEAQWKALPDYVKGDLNVLVMADTSGSMTCNNMLPMLNAVSLAIYFAERNTGAFQNLWMNFSDRPTVQRLRGLTLNQKLQSIDMENWGCSTNMEAAFKAVLDIAVKNHVPQEEMVKSIIVISDMEINEASSCSGWDFYDGMRERFEEAGYEIPNLVFWNVSSLKDTFLVDGDREGVQLCSGSSPATFEALMRNIGKTPTEAMLDVLLSERYAPVSI